jgi:hypothetical protein
MISALILAAMVTILRRGADGTLAPCEAAVFLKEAKNETDPIPYSGPALSH